MTGPASHPPALRSRWRATFLLGVGDSLNYGDRAVMSVVLPLLQRDLGLSDFGLGLLGSLFLWTYAAGSPLAGFAADRLSRRRLAMGSLALWSLVMVATGFARSLAGLSAMRVTLGLAECFYLPAAIALVGDYHHARSRARAMAVLSGTERIGIVAVGSLAGLIALHHGWRWAFWAMGAIGLATAAIFRAFFPGEPPASGGDTRPSLGETLGYLVRVPAYWLLVIKVVLVGVAVWIFFTWLPYYFHEQFGMNLAAAGLAGTWPMQVAGLLGLALGGWISDRVAARRDARHRMAIEGLAYAVAAPFLLAFALRPSAVVVTLALLAFGFIRNVGDAGEQAILCEVVPSRYRSTAVGLMNMGATAAGGLGVLASGILKPHFGLNAIFTGAGALAGLAAAVLLVGYRFFYSPS